MVAQTSISKTTLLNIIKEIPAEEITFEILSEKVFAFFKTKETLTKNHDRGKEFKIFQQKLYKNNKKPNKKTAISQKEYEQNLLKVSIWSEEDLTIFEENHHHINKWNIDTW